jgi:RNA polymerase sigma-70 factor (ECF subfamily)
MEQVLNRLRAEQAALGKERQFEQLQDCLMADPEAPRYADLAGRLGLSPDAVKMAVCRLRQRYRELLRSEIAQTVSSPAEVEEEIRHLFAVLAG